MGPRPRRPRPRRRPAVRKAQRVGHDEQRRVRLRRHRRRRQHDRRHADAEHVGRIVLRLARPRLPLQQPPAIVTHHARVWPSGSVDAVQHRERADAVVRALHSIASFEQNRRIARRADQYQGGRAAHGSDAQLSAGCSGPRPHGGERPAALRQTVVEPVQRVLDEEPPHHRAPEIDGRAVV